MNHQPFEVWILDDKQINPQERELLDRHLKDCPECYRLDHAWSKARRQLESTPLRAPQTGFVARWQSQFAQRQKVHERQQARTLLISLGSGGGAVLVALIALFLPKFSLISLLVRSLTTIIRLFNGLDAIWSVFLGLVRTAPTITILITGVLLAGLISLATFAFGISLWRISLKGVKAK
jgi:anti-sigma factor RsiW